MTNFQLFTQICIKLTKKLVSSFSGAPLVLGQAMGDFGFTRFVTAQTRGKPPPSPIQYFIRLSAAPTSEWFFVPGLAKRSFEITKVWTPTILQDYNVLLKPPIGMRLKAKLQLLLRTFQHCVALHLHAQGSSRFSTFYGLWFKVVVSRPFFFP